MDSSRGRRAAAAAAECRRCSQVRAAARHSQLCKSLARDDRHAAARRTADCQRHERDEHRGLSRQQGRERTCVPVVVVRRTAPERALPSIVRQPRAAAAHRNVDLELRCLQGPDGAGDERQPGGGGRLQAGGQQSADSLLQAQLRGVSDRLSALAAPPTAQRPPPAPIHLADTQSAPLPAACCLLPGNHLTAAARHGARRRSSAALGSRCTPNRPVRS